MLNFIQLMFLIPNALKKKMLLTVVMVGDIK